MKRQRLGSMIIAILGVIFVQLCFCSSALAQQWVANGNFKFKQAGADSGGTFKLQQAGTVLTGTVDHWFAASVAKELDESATNAHWTSGPVLGGQVIGDRFSLQVRYHSVFWKQYKLLHESIYVYEGTITTGGYVTGTVWEALHPDKKFGFSIEEPFAKFVPPPAAPPPKPIKSSGKAKSSSGGSSGPTAGANPAPWVNLVGKWETQAGGKTLIMDLTQNGDLVEGRYDVVGAAPINGSLLGRIAPDGRLTFNWKQSDGTGVGTFMPDRSCYFLQGGYTSQTPVVANGAWSGKRATADTPRPPAAQVFPVFPPTLPFQAQTLRNEQLKQLNRVYSGKWVVKTKSGAEFTMMFTQSGNTVSGTYQPKNGKVDGTIADDGLLTYRWSDESGATGAGIFAIYEGVQLIGTYSTSQNPWEVSGQWAGGRQ